MSSTKAFRSDNIFTGDVWLHDHAVVTMDGIIEQIVPASELGDGLPVEHFRGCVIAPAFIDLQIYGAHQKLFAVYPEPASLYKLREYCGSGGAAYCLPTVATNASDVFRRCIDAIRKYWKEGGEGILGLHIEGPWINPVKRGAHIESFIHSPGIAEVDDLITYGDGVIKMITLAPEVCGRPVIDLILSRGIKISAGHSNATYGEAILGFDHGIRTATHLFNAMSPLQHRQPGLVGAIFNDERVMSSIIPDGHHVDYEAIRIANKIMGERLFAITDAVTETNAGYYQHYLADDKYESAGILSGSALTMIKACRNLVNHVNVELGQALQMCGRRPAKIIGLENELGSLQKGYRAKMVVINANIELVKMIG